MNVGELQFGASARVRSVGGVGALRIRLLEMGLTPGTRIQLTRTAPMGDPVEISVRGYYLTLRLSEAEKIEIYEVQNGR